MFIIIPIIGFILFIAMIGGILEANKEKKEKAKLMKHIASIDEKLGNRDTLAETKISLKEDSRQEKKQLSNSKFCVPMKPYAWIFGIIFFLIGFVSLFGQPLEGITLLLAAGFLLPPVTAFIKKKWDITLSRNNRVIATVILLLLFMVFITTSYNTTQSSVVSSIPTTPTPVSQSASPAVIQSQSTTSVHENTPKKTPKKVINTVSPIVQQAVPVTPPVPLPTWHTVLTYNNNTAIQTSPFTMNGSEWRITFSCTVNLGAPQNSSQFDGFIESADSGTPVGNFASFVNCPHTDTSYMYGQTSGQYYLNLLDANSAYTVTVEDYY